MIATEHATPAACYQHTLYQLRVLHQSLMNDFIRGIEAKRTFEYKWSEADPNKPQWWKDGKGDEKLCWYDTDRLRHEHELEELKMSVKDKLLQMTTFTRVLEQMEEAHGGAFTAAELNDEEPEYWRLRIARQMGDEYLDRQTGLGTGNLKTLRMATADSPLPESKNSVTDFPDLLNAVLAGREPTLDVLNELNEELFGHMNTLGQKQDTAALEHTPDQATSSPAEKPQSAPQSPSEAAKTADAAQQQNKLSAAGIQTAQKDSVRKQ